MAPSIRMLTETDDLVALTALLHRAYASLGAMGLNYTAFDQSVETTRSRIQAGTCFVAVVGDVLVGTVVVRPPEDPSQPAASGSTPWYRRPDVAIFGQLGVDPAWAGRGIGQRLVAQCEAWARERGFHWLALDTAEPASHLRRLYVKLGYVDVDSAQWTGKHYRSVIMVKALMDRTEQGRTE